MVGPNKLTKGARKLRDDAKRARRMISWPSMQSDRARIERYIEDLDRRAAELEQQAAQTDKGALEASHVHS